MGKVIFFPETTQNPITIIGQRAGCCWGSDTTSPEKNYRRGIECLENNHGRTLEFAKISCMITGYSARVMREWYTHIGGAPTRLQASTRYIDYKNFDYITPHTIKNNSEATKIYRSVMEHISAASQQLEQLSIPREDISMTLPLSMATVVVDDRNLRNVLDMAQQRMCGRAYWEYREMFHDFCTELAKISSEWEYIVSHYFKPKCEYLGYCPEKFSCGRMQKERKNI